MKKEKFNNDDLFNNITLVDLYNIYNELLENYSRKQNNNIGIINRNIKRDDYKIEDKYDYILNVLSIHEKINFTDVIYNCSCKLECVVTFLALLELIKQKKVKAYQIENFGEIIIEGCKEDE